MQEIKLNGESMNIVEDNIEKLKSIFPDVFTEGKVDFDKLQDVLGNYIEKRDERYNFTWNGKSAALRLAQTPSTGTLRPCKKESKDWDATQNLYIEGDNLEVLKLLQKSYHNKIKMIYIDPPYNTGGDFVYPDDFKDNLDNYKKITGQIDSEGNKISSNTESDGRYHTNWLNMMYPRLRLARNLLSDDGVIFISIGQEEINNIINICNETFGETNKLGIISRQMKSGGNQGKCFSKNIDYILVYAKNSEFVVPFREPLEEELINKVYNQIETKGEKAGEKYRLMGLYQAGLDEWRPNQKYFITCPDGTRVLPPCSVQDEVMREGDGRWRWSKDRFNKELELGNIEFKQTATSPLLDEQGNSSKWNIYTKIWLNDRLDEGRIPVDLITKFENRHSSAELKKLNIPFDFAKPSELIKKIISFVYENKNMTILDFFSGSATTADAIMQLNADDNGNRKFIMVQLPEITDEKSENYKAGFKNICEIGKERIRRAGDKIKEEIESGNTQLKLGEEPKKVPDIGFKVFKLDTSNIKKWSGNADTIESEIQGSIFNYEVDRSELDVVYEIMLKCGLDLTYPIEEINVNGKTLYSIGAGAMFVCMDDKITQDIANKIVEIKDANEIVEPVAVFKDNGFKTDSNKTNIKETLRVAGIKDFITV